MHESPRGLDIAGLTGYLVQRVPGLLTGDPTARLIAGGRSNLTYLVDDGTHSWVVRRPPLGHVLETAHDMTREYRIMSALDGSPVPVPRMVVLESDPKVLGAPFYVMSFVEGTVYRSGRQLAHVGREDAESIADGLVDVLARLHGIEPATVGLDGLGRPEGFLTRQVARWGKQMRASWTRDIPGAEDLGRRLARDVPQSPKARIVHGDFKLDNVVFDPGMPGEIRAVLDWEMATLGDPLTDLVNLAVWWDGVFDSSGRPFTGVPGLVPGFPGSDRLLEHYARLTSADLGPLPWYFGLAYYKLAGIFEGMFFRAQQGLTLGEGFDLLEGLAPELVQRGHAAMDGLPV